MALVGLILMAGIFVWALRRGFWYSPPHRGDMDRAGWTRWEIGRHRGGASPLSFWDGRVKIVSMLFLCFCIGALSRIPTALFALLSMLACACLARVSARLLLKRVAAAMGFLWMFMVIMPLTVKAVPGDVIYQLEGAKWLAFNPRGLTLALKALIKASAIVVVVVMMVGTPPFSQTIRALEGLRVPPMAVQMILMSYRYLFVFAQEMERMATAMRARGFRPRTTLRTLRVIGNFVGVLLIRSFERTERILHAMEARGFSGSIPRYTWPAVGTGDLLLGVAAGGLGLALNVADRLLPPGVLG